MNVRFAPTDVDQYFAEGDVLTLYWVVGVLNRQGDPLPEEAWLFARLVEWAGATRSGIWQYYEALPETTFEQMAQALERFGLAEIAAHYRSGWHLWREPTQVAGLDRWIDDHETTIYASAAALLARCRDALCRPA